ncbi:MAG TPA: class I SAM-dependent methyltransferase [Ktedonobacteraceae bacterium]|nr:class I SAM-dependent methyltransferase [Ktedonobacteraceae bacterium]
MTDYNLFARFYDAVMGEPTETISLLETLIEDWHPKAKHVLELACGTGAVLQHLHSSRAVVGLDLSEGMLEIARRKMPAVPFYQGDMSAFTLPQSFDLILCLYDSINHLTTFAQWQHLFVQVDRHLDKEGLFIFDLNTLVKLERLAQAPTFVQTFAGNYLLTDVLRTESDLYTWRLQVFEALENDLYRRHEANILEASFPLLQIEQEVKEHFEIKRLVDPHNAEVVSTTGRVYFVCKKRAERIK